MPQDAPGRKPEILAPAGDTAAFLAALAAGADAVYAGLKHYSARMQAGNFSMAELARLGRLAEDHGAKLYVPMNVLVKNDELAAAGRLLDRLARQVRPAALIVQDLGLLPLARQAGFEGELHLSTLANVSHAAGFAALRGLGVRRVILPRELSVDEIKACAAACPADMDLEIFIHGALCFGVSGRCTWSSFLGGKSGLRGRCVQPCRRMYSQQDSELRAFSCRDLSLDVLVRTLVDLPRLACWKIEGRKKGPHYVYYTVAAYKLLRDGNGSSESKKAAQEILDQALGRPATHYRFLPQRSHSAVTPGESTASGRYVGKTQAVKQGRCPLVVREALLAGDLLRVGSEEDAWHQTVPVRRGLPKGGRLDIKVAPGKAPRPGTPVFLIDRREPELVAALGALTTELEHLPQVETTASTFTPRLPRPSARPRQTATMSVWRQPPSGRIQGDFGLWFDPDHRPALAKPLRSKVWWWLPPVVWPDEEVAWAEALASLVADGARRLVCNAPWQVGLLPRDVDLTLWAGPFCNQANGLSLEVLRGLGYAGAFVSPELSGEELLALPGASPLPLGVVSGGWWPLCLSRTMAQEVRPEQPLASPKGEALWTRRYGQNWWVYPGWPLDLGRHGAELRAAGYALLAELQETPPRGLAPRRTTEFNWNLQLL